MRARISDKDRKKLFTGLKQRGVEAQQLAEVCGVTIRTVSNWRSGRSTLPYEHLRRIASLSGVSLDSLTIDTLTNWWNNQQAGRKGAKARMDKHGQLGKPDSRRLGGTNSYLKRRDSPSDIFSPKVIFEPERGDYFAEFIGILIGDGCVTKYQVSISASSLVDLEYAQFVARLVEQLFGIQPSLLQRKDANCINVVLSSVKLVGFLKQEGILQGDKLRQNLDMPHWIFEKTSYKIACLRGIFDTDGCVFQESHRIGGKVYSYPRLAFVSMSDHLRASIKGVLLDLGFSPKIRNDRSVNLESFTDISRYFKIIGSSNPKHINRFYSFGRVA